MANKSKEKNFQDFNDNIKNKPKANKKILKDGKLKGTKEEKFDFNEEIVIGLKRIDDNEEKKEKKERQKKEKQKKKKTKEQKPKEKQKKLTRKQEIARKKRRAVLKVLGGTTCIGILIGGAICFLLSPVFNINNITVTGNKKLSSNEIISLSTLTVEENMFKYNFGEIEKNIKENPYIEKVKLNRKLPDTVEVVVEEREATYMLQIANAYAYLDNQGYILEISEEKKILPIIKGIKTKQEEIHPGDRLVTEDLKKLNDVLKIMESAHSNALAKFITTIDITDKENYLIRMEDKKKTVHFGDASNISTKMLLITEFIEEEKNTEGEIFLNMNLNDENNMPYFRKKV